MGKQTYKQIFIQHLQTHQGLIHHLCCLYYPSEEDQKDAFQDIVLELWKSYKSFRGESKFSTWMYKVALYTLLKKQRKERKEIQAQNLETYKYEAFSSPNKSDQDFELLQQFLAQIRPLDRAILILHLEAYNYLEIASILEISANQVGSQLHRIKKKLQNQFKSNYHETK